MAESKLTKLQLETLAKIKAGEVEQIKFGYGAWRIWGASPTVVGRLISLALAKWTTRNDDRVACEITEAGRAALQLQGGSEHV